MSWTACCPERHGDPARLQASESVLGSLLSGEARCGCRRVSSQCAANCSERCREVRCGCRREGLPCAANCLERHGGLLLLLLLMHSLHPGASLQRTTQMSELVSIRNLSLRTWSVMNRRLEGAEQASAAINTCRCHFPADGRSTVVYVFASCPQIASGTDSNCVPRGCMLEGGHRSPCVCLWNESTVGCGH